MKKLLLLPLLLFLMPAWASSPGQPLDCSDWVFVEPGLSCEITVPAPCDHVTNRACALSNGDLQLDVTGRLLWTDRVFLFEM